MSIFSRLFRSRDKPSNRVGAGFYFPFGGTPAGKAVNERTAMQTTAVYACVRILAETLAALPLHVYHYKPDGGKERLPSHPLYRLLHDEPNPEMSSFVFRETLMVHLLLWGNAFAQIIRDGRGRVLALYPLLPSRMDVERNKAGALTYTYNREYGDKGGAGSVTLRREDVLHIPGLGFDGLIGYSPIAMARNAVGMSIAAEEYGSRFFSGGANPGGVLTYDGTVNNPDKIRDSWQSGFGGSGNAHKIAVLEGGMKYQQIGIPPEQAQFLATRKFQLNEIARIFRIPPHMIGDLDKSSFSNIEHQSLEFVKYALDPWVVRWEQALQQALLLPGEKAELFINFNLDGLLRGAYADRMRGYQIALQNGLMTPNECRSLENLDAVPEGDILMVNGNMQKLKDVGVFYNKPTTAERMIKIAQILELDTR